MDYSSYSLLDESIDNLLDSSFNNCIKDSRTASSSALTIQNRDGYNANLMTSTSTLWVQKSFKYDVFLSFRGEDTRKTFVDHLYKALDDKGIITYKDDEKIQKGERISDQLLRSIEESRFYIIIFSKNYASSSWCLDELVKIMECQKSKEQTAYPIFFDVEPTEVRNQKGAVGEAFAKHEKGSVLPLDRLCCIVASCCNGSSSSLDRDLENEDDVGRWINAMKEAAGLAGMELRNTFNGHEAKFIQQIVQYISLKLRFINFTIDGKLVGMETRVKSIVSSLEIGSDDVRMIGIKGMGGGGKTTLARAVFDHISAWFEGSCFVENVREVSKGSLSGLKKLQKQMLKDVLNDQSIVVKSVSDGKNKMIKMMGSRKVLVVLDDVDDIEQLEALAGELTWFKSGSIIIITTRDEQVLIAHGVRSDAVHGVNLLTNEEAICLFSRYAFKRELPNQGYEELSKKVVHYATGLPLTVKVLGSHLCGRSELEWVDAIERLKAIPLKETLKRLEISYDGLEDDQKEIFLDVVCILKGEWIYDAIRVLESRGFNAQIGLRILEQKSLITISHHDDDDDDDDVKYLGMHDHIEEMGRNIVRRLHPHEPSRHSRLWIKDEIEDIMVNELVSETRIIKLKDTDLPTTIIMKGLRNMRALRCLFVNNRYENWEIDEVSQYLPETLQSLSWPGYGFRRLPKTFRANKLVNLTMRFSKISELWEGGERKVLNNMRFLDLSGSKLRAFDLRMTPHLEELNLSRCKHFVELHMPVECLNLKSLDLSGSKLKTFDLRMTPRLEELFLESCFDFVELHLPVECPNLKSLGLSCSMLRTLDLRLTPRLEKLNLGGCNEFVELYLPFECTNLRYLDLGGSKLRTFDLKLAPHLEKLNIGGCNDFVELYLPFECTNLRHLDFSGSKLRTFDLRLTPRLEKLYLGGCNEFVELYLPFECLNLKFLDLSGSRVSNLNLGMTPNIELLNLQDCYSLQEIHAPVGCLKNIHSINLSGCLRFEYFLFERKRESGIALLLNVEFCDTCRLHPHNNLPKFKFECKYEESQPAWSENLEKLIYFGVCACTKLESFSASICGLQHLKELTLEGSIPPEALLHDLYRLETLEILELCMKEIKHIPDGIYMLKHLKTLRLRSCERLEQIPENIRRLECLKSLVLSDCILIEKLPEELRCLDCLEGLNITGSKSLRHIPNSICNMKCLISLDLSNCILIEKLPEELGRLERLEDLNLTGCNSLRHIPNSICKMKCLVNLGLSDCILVEKLPEEFGRLLSLKFLYIVDAGISHLPESIYQLKGLLITGSMEQFESFGFTSVTQEYGDCYSVQL